MFVNPLEKIEIITFDCYGTLIDWESGIRGVLGELAGAHAVTTDMDQLMLEWEAIQFDLISASWRPYREILRVSLDELFCRYCVTLGADEADLLACRIGTWAPFDDTFEVLTRLRSRYKLAVLSNIDDDMLSASVAQIGVSFDELITAQQVQSYKPRTAHFQEALRRFDAPADRFLHCAFGFKYDQRPALGVGMSTAWVKRPGWIRDDVAEPTHEVVSLTELAELLGV